MNKSENLTKVIRINSIVDVPSSIESLHYIDNENLLTVARSDDSIELWNTNTWIQLTKISGVKGKFLFKINL
jgi:hypothetical protein